MSTTFTPLVQGFSWTPATTAVGGAALPSGETESGATIGIRADGDTTHAAGNYQWLVVVPPTQASETLTAINGALSTANPALLKGLPPGNYWAALDQTDMLAGSPATSAWTPEVPFSIPTPVPVLAKPAPPTNFSAA